MLPPPRALVVSPVGLPVLQLVRLVGAVPWLLSEMERTGFAILGTPEDCYRWRDLDGSESLVRFDTIGAALADYCSDRARLCRLAASWVMYADSEGI